MANISKHGLIFQFSSIAEFRDFETKTLTGDIFDNSRTNYGKSKLEVKPAAGLSRAKIGKVSEL
jgi:hypothetical protein